MPNDNVIAFLPGKAGSGSSITALNVANCLARSWKQKVLLIDADFNSGLLSFLLNVFPPRSIADALESTGRLDEVWGELATNTPRLDLLPAPADRRRPAVSGWKCQSFLACAAKRYQTIVADLPDVIDEVTQPLITQARCVCVVCTPETTSLLLGKERIAMVQRLGVQAGRINIVLNRCREADPSRKDIEDILQRPVLASLPKDEMAVRKSISGGRVVEEGSRLARAFSMLAQTLAGSERPAEVQGGGWRSWLWKSTEPKHRPADAPPLV